MANENNPAMDSAAQQPLRNAPSAMAGYNPLGSGNAQMDAAFAQYAMPMLMQLMGGQFIPQQFPAQSVMDQMVASKYLTASKMAERVARARGTDAMTEKFKGMYLQLHGAQPSAMGANNLNALAGTVNSEFGMMFAEMIMGPQNAEDFFFGRKGDPVQLQRAISQMGFYRPDSVSGADRFSAQTLDAFSTQIYDNLYGPDADLNDISGLSAGRTGSMLTELARRGLLPTSMSKMGAEERARELGYDRGTDKFADPAINKTMEGLPANVRAAFANNLPMADIESLEGGAAGIRKVDAARVSNSLKNYSESVKAVRQIFGDNGMANAPMNQLMAALEALTQNSMSTMNANRVENLMRRTQMASRDSGVNLEALMGLTARSGALAQQAGLTPEIAVENNITAMEHSRTMSDHGSFRPAFGRMDQDKALLFVAEAGLRSNNSQTGKYLGALARIVAENPRGMRDSDAAKLINALQNGEATYVNRAGKTVNISEELGRRSNEFVSGILRDDKISREQFNAAVMDPNTQEFQIGLQGVGDLQRQAAEYKTNIATVFAGNSRIAQRGAAKGMKKAEALDIERTISDSFAASFVDEVDNTMTPEKRVDTLYAAMKRSLVQRAMSNGKNNADAITEAESTIATVYGSEEAARESISTQFALTGHYLRGLGVTPAQVQETYKQRNLLATEARSKRNRARAGMDMDLGDGSNFIQRFSDALAGTGNKTFMEAILGTINSSELEAELLSSLSGKDKEAVAAELENLRTEYSASVIDTDEERQALTASVLDGTLSFGDFKKRVEDAGSKEFKNRETLVSREELRGRVAAAAADKEKGRTALAQTYSAIFGGDISEIEARFANEATAAQAIDELTNSPMLRAALLRTGSGLNLLGDKEASAAEVTSFISDENVALLDTSAFDHIADPAARAQAIEAQRSKIKAIGRLGQQMNAGQVGGGTLLERYGIKDEGISDQLNKFLSGKEVSPEELQAALSGNDATRAQADRIYTFANFARQVNLMGGFEAMGAAGVADAAKKTGRRTALEQAARDKVISGDLASAIEKKRKLEDPGLSDEEKQTYQLSEAEQKAYDKAMLSSNDDFQQQVREFIDRGVSGNRDELAANVAKNAQSAAEGAMGAMGEAGGVIGNLMSQMGEGLKSSITSAMTSAFKDVKIENVTITNFKLPEGFGAELASGAVNAVKEMIAQNMTPEQRDAIMTSMIESAQQTMQSMALSGKVKLEGLQELIMTLVGDTAEEVGGGAPVAAGQSTPAPK